MTVRSALLRALAQEDVNFLLTNRIPRRFATRFMGWLSRVEQPQVRGLSLTAWRFFCDVDLSDAKTTAFRSLREAFIRELKEGARPIDPDPDVLVSPCDAIVGASGPIQDGAAYQIKGFPYRLEDLLGDPAASAAHRDGTFVTLRLTAGMYHRFHAPADATIESLAYLSGDTWNVNPIALKRVEGLFCRNERAVLRLRLHSSEEFLTLVPVAAILVASLRFGFMPEAFEPRRNAGRTITCGTSVRRGEELGWFEHGSTIVVLAPPCWKLCSSRPEGARVRVGEPLLRRRGACAQSSNSTSAPAGAALPHPGPTPA